MKEKLLKEKVQQAIELEKLVAEYKALENQITAISLKKNQIALQINEKRGGVIILDKLIKEETDGSNP